MKRDDPVIGERDFTDGVRRSVHQSADGRQYVLDESRTPDFGVWILTGEREALVANKANGRRPRCG
jgi:hypothetical protein